MLRKQNTKKPSHFGKGIFLYQETPDENPTGRVRG